MLTYVEKGPLVTFKGLVGKRPDYLVTVNKRNIAGDPDCSGPNDSLHFVNVPVRVSEKQVAPGRVRPAGVITLQMGLNNHEEVKTVKELLTTA